MSDVRQDNFEDFPSVVHWIRQTLGLILGIVWGIIPLTGAVGVGRFCHDVN
jgi:hypothetical protein